MDFHSLFSLCFSIVDFLGIDLSLLRWTIGSTYILIYILDMKNIHIIDCSYVEW